MWAAVRENGVFLEIGLRSMLRSLIRILRASLVQIDAEMTNKYSNQRYAVDALSTNTQCPIQPDIRRESRFLPTPRAFDAPVGGGVPVGISAPPLVQKN